MIKIDKTDIKILQLLQNNARIKNTDLGKLVSLTPPAVAERLRKLEDSGVIEGYHTVINPEKIGKNLIAFVSLQVTNEYFKPFLEFVNQNSKISECHHIIGRNCLLLKVMIQNTGELKELITQIKKFGTTETSIVLSTLKKYFPID